MPITTTTFISDKDVAAILCMSCAWVRQQRFLRKRGESHNFDVEPIQIGRSVRYRLDEVMDWVNGLSPPG